MFAATYDSLEKLIKILQEVFAPMSIDEILGNYILIVDEYHDFVTQNNFRYKAFETIKNYESKFKKVIYMTGTPELVFKFKENNKTYIFKKDPEKINYNIIKTKQVEDNLISLIVDNIVDGKIDVVLIDDKKKANAIKAALEELLPNKKIAVISAETKEDIIIQNIIDKGLIPNDIDILLTTSVISDGINILNKNINNLYFNREYNVLKKMQFIARFRNGFNAIFDIGTYNTTKKYIDLEYEFNRMHEAADILATVLNDNSKEFEFEIKHSLLNSIGNEMISKVERNYVPNEETIKFYTMQKLTRFLRNISSLKAFLSEFYNIEANVFEISKNKQLVNLTELIKIEKENEQKLIDQILDDPAKWVTAYYRKKGELEFMRSELEKFNLYSNEFLLLIEEQLLNKAVVKNTIDKIILLKIKLHKENFTKQDIQQLSTQQLIRAYDFLTIFKNELVANIIPEAAKEFSRTYEEFEYNFINYLKEITKEMIGKTMNQTELINHLTKLASETFEEKQEAIRNVVKRWVKAVVILKPAKVNKKKVYKISDIKSIGQFLLELGFDENKISDVVDSIIIDTLNEAVDKLKTNYKELKLDNYNLKYFYDINDFMRKNFNRDIDLHDLFESMIDSPNNGGQFLEVAV